MSENHSTSPALPSKPAKPYPDFPLFPHATGRWAKKINGKTRYFGPWDDPEGSLRAYQDFVAGRPTDKPCTDKPRRVPHGPNRPTKPTPAFPLFAHAAGYWAKKIRGRLVYFGPWSDPDGALAKYLEQKDALHAGRKPREATDGTTVKELVNRFLNQKRTLVDGGELSPRTWTDYKDACDQLVSEFGKTRLVADLDPDDFTALRKKMAKKWGPHRLAKTIQCVRCVFKYGYEAGEIERPLRYGPGFARPSKKTLRLHKAKQGPKLFEAEELRKMIDGAALSLKAMILLGINAAFGNADCGHLPLSALDLDGAWVRFPRPKTGIDRRCPLWPETVAALHDALAKRPVPKAVEDAALVFVTKYGHGWAKDTSDAPVTKELRKLLDALGINGHRNFYTLRHTFRTVADEAKDQPAVDFIMGHESPHVASVYRERISDERLKAVTDHVRAWLFPPAPKAQPGAGAATEVVNDADSRQNG
jgi:integrase